MTHKVSPIPKGYHAITPYLIVRGAANAIQFYKRAFGATEMMRMPRPDKKIGHAELKIGDSILMLADEDPEKGSKSPQTIGGSPVVFHLYVEDVDAVAQKAVAAGAKLIQPIKDQFYGDRTALLSDPFGHFWNVATHVKDVSHEEMQEHIATMMSSEKD